MISVAAPLASAAGIGVTMSGITAERAVLTTKTGFWRMADGTHVLVRLPLMVVAYLLAALIAGVMMPWMVISTIFGPSRR